MKRLFAVALSAALFLTMPGLSLAATGTITGVIKGPHGETAPTSYAFTNKATGVKTAGVTAADGSFTATIDGDAEYSFLATPDTTKEGYAYAGELSIPSMRFPSGITLNMGEIHFHTRAGEQDKDLDAVKQQLPSQCTSSPANGAPFINRVEYVDAKKGTFLYAGNKADIKIFADRPGYNVIADYSILEGQQPGSVMKPATDNGDGSYTASHTITKTDQGGGMVIVTATNSQGQTSFGCSPDGPVNLDIRSFFTGDQTTSFPALAASPSGDFRSMNNFTMHQKDIVKVAFKKPVNMLDSTVQNFMKAIAQKMVSAKGKINLDAKAVLELKNAGAEITMYGLPDYTSAPTILLDGATAGEAVTGITYDRATKSVTFTAAHFSEYTAVPTLTVTDPTSNISTGASTYTVTGSVNDVTSTVTITVNGVSAGAVTVGSTGVFSQTITLADGANTIVVAASNSVGAAPSITRTITKVLPPTLTVAVPTADVTTSDATFTVTGTATGSSPAVTITVNGTSAGSVTVESDGSFSHLVNLTVGTNTIVVGASTAGGNATAVTRTITRQALPVTGIPTALLGFLSGLLVLGVVLVMRPAKRTF